MADAAQAYIQATLRGTPGWIDEAVPEDDNKRWNQFKRPVKALYGHPDAGTVWEQRCDELVRAMGFQPVGEEWPSVYTHPELQLVLAVYVDDFEMAGPTAWIHIWVAISPKVLWFSATATRSPL